MTCNPFQTELTSHTKANTRLASLGRRSVGDRSVGDWYFPNIVDSLWGFVDVALLNMSKTIGTQYPN